MTLKSFPKFSAFPLGKVRPAGWILRQMQQDLDEGFAGCLDSLTVHAKNDLFKDRIESSADQVAWWDAETRGNWLWGYVMMSFLSGNVNHQQRVEKLLEELKNTQDDDGYIGIYSTASRFNHHDSENGELWGQSRALLPLLAYYEFTGDAEYLRVVERAVRLTMNQYAQANPFQHQSNQKVDGITGITHGLCYLDVLEWLFALTGDSAYRDFGIKLYADFSSISLPFANDDMSSLSLADGRKAFSGHSAHTAEHLRAVLWAGRDEAIQKNAVKKLRHYLLPNGALFGDESIHGSPIPDIGYEYCTMTELLFSVSSLLQKTSDPAHGDWIENIAFNAGQGARLSNGRAISYLSVDTRFEAESTRRDAYSIGGSGGRFKFSPTHEDVACCCNPNAVRFMPHYVSKMWMGLQDEGGVAAVCYGPSALEISVSGVAVKIIEETDYPFSDAITFKVSAQHPVQFSLYLRKPEWVLKYSVNADGMEVSEESGWIKIQGIWQLENIVHLNLTGGARAIPYGNGMYALYHGPLQYVLPLRSTPRPVKEYAGANLYDLELFPANLAQDYLPVLLNASKDDLGFKKEYDPHPDHAFPWGNSSLRLVNETAALVPMGCSALRCAAFPLIKE